MITTQDIIDVLPIVTGRGWNIVEIQRFPRRLWGVRSEFGESPLGALAAEIYGRWFLTSDPTLGANLFLRLSLQDLPQAALKTEARYRRAAAPYEECIRSFALACDDHESPDRVAILRALELRT